MPQSGGQAEVNIAIFCPPALAVSMFPGHTFCALEEGIKFWEHIEPLRHPQLSIHSEKECAPSARTFPM